MASICKTGTAAPFPSSREKGAKELRMETIWNDPSPFYGGRRRFAETERFPMRTLIAVLSVWALGVLLVTVLPG
jgi:hypothetical protein